MKNIVISLGISTILLMGTTHLLQAQNDTTGQNKAALARIDLTGWPEAARMAATEMMDQYGSPDAASKEVLIWLNEAHWKFIKVTRTVTAHQFPIPHTDMLMQSVAYKVPVNKISELARFDGSISVERTQGLLSARCDKQANNLLALNLAHDIITGKTTATQARQQMTTILQQANGGKKHPYMERLQFTPAAITGDEDASTAKSNSGKTVQ